MKLKNDALQELYDTIGTVVKGPVIAPYGFSPIDNAFQKCDDALTSPSDATYWSYWYNKAQLAEKKLERANKEIEKLRREVSAKDKRNNELQKQLLEQAGHTDSDLKERADASETCMNEYAKQVYDLKQDLDNLKKANGVLASTNAALAATITTMKENDKKHSEKVAVMRRSLERVVEERDDAKKQLNYFTHSRDDWRSRAKHAEEESKKRGEKICELKRRLNQIPVTKDRYAEGYSDGNEEGKEELWDMLRNVRDTQPNEFDPECECLGDVIDMDLEDFLDAYKKWQEDAKRIYEQKETERMRNWLTDFCRGRVCKGCPLESSEYKCGCGYSFKRDMYNRFDPRIIPDEDIKRYYEKARGCGRYTLPNDIYEKMKDAENKMNKWLTSMDSWECTLEGTFEINKELLNEICGVKPKEEEHQLEYGDAVRLPWRDYDYMYIGPTEKGPNVRLFDPKRHAVVVTHILNAKYTGGKIILTSEEDLRKIWKDKK